MKKIELSVAAAFVICFAAALLQVPFSMACAKTRGDTLRLHIVANSDSELDQAVKLAVRDAIIENSGDFAGGAQTKEEAVESIAENLGKIESIADGVLAANGLEYRAHAVITEMFFNQKSYETATLPAGIYTALRIELGRASGHNWWCVVYPTLCIPGASEPLSEYSEEERQVVLGGEKYVIRFKTEELIQKLINEFSEKREA